MKKLKNNMNGIILCLFEIVIGVLLLIDPVGFTTVILTGAGIVLMVIGVVSIVRYFLLNARDAAIGQYLCKGLIALLAGAFCAFRSEWFIITFPAITLIYGAFVLVTGLGKVQLAIDMARGKNKKWFLALISAAISIICGVVILRSPFSSTAVLWTFTGVSLIVESVFDLVTLIVSGRKPKEPIEEDFVEVE